MTAVEDREFEELLDYIKRSREFDFTGYKRPSLTRRIERRMQTVGIEGYRDYLDLLEAQPHEFAQLFDTILINVTSFFRDPSTWEYLGEEIAPRIAEAKRPNEPIRIWSSGCSSGQEAYTAAILFAELLGGDEFQARVKIYGTDVDDDALTTARHASYSAENLKPVAEALRHKYFEPGEDGRFLVRPELRRHVVFGRHDLVQDPPISRIDLLIARNTLIYFSPKTQATVLENFHFSLNHGGFLLLGKSEVVPGRSQLFEPIDVRRRVFAPVPSLGFRNRLLTLVGEQYVPERARSDTPERLRQTGFDLAPIGHLILEEDRTVAFANAQARHMFGMTQHDLGKSLSDLEIARTPLELRGLVDRAHADRRPVTVDEVAWSSDSGDIRHLDVQVVPILGADGMVGTSITFADVSRYKHTQEMAESAKEQLAEAFEQAQSSAEELETTNEELQSTNEELETTNEELQSTNEELEAMNEELQSTNEELGTLNEEMRRRTNDLDRANELMETVLGQIEVAVIVVDLELRVEAWNSHAEDLWGLSADKVHGKNLLDLEIGFPVDELRKPLEDALGGKPSDELIVPAVSRLGKTIECRVTCAALEDSTGSPRGAIIVMNELEEGSE